jgi:hypothetical protein
MWKVFVAGTIAIFAMSDEQPIHGAQGAADFELIQRLAQADTVITGVVVATAPVQGQPRGFEHGPDWQRATIEIESVEKGHLTAKTIDVLFANSTDIAWYRSPKLKKGDRGVWLLHNRDPFGKATPGLAVVHAADKQPITDLEKVRGLLKNSRKP